MSDEALIKSGQLLGTVLAVQANFYRVQLDSKAGEAQPAEEVEGERKERIEKKNSGKFFFYYFFFFKQKTAYEMIW